MQTNQIGYTCPHQALEFFVLIEPSLELFYKPNRASLKLVFRIEIFITEVWDKLVAFFDGFLLDTSGL